MKKRLLMQLLAVVCTVAAYASYNRGDYIYSPTAKYKVTGDNLVTNGAFNVGDGTQGWTNETAGALDGATWGVQTGVGPNGENALASLKASADEGATLCNVWQLSAGFYTISYWVKSPSATTSSIVAGGNNYVNFFVNETGDNTVTTAVATAASLMDTWTEVVMTVTATSDCYLVFNANNVATDVMFTNFEIHQAVEVYDTRIAERYVSSVEKLLSEPGFAEGADEILGMLGMVKETLAAGPEDGSDITSLIDEFDVLYQEYINSVAGNLVGTYLTAWSSWGYMNWNNMTNRNTWTFEGGRWGFSPNDTSLERPEGDGYVASAGIQTSYRLGPDAPCGVRIYTGTFNNTSLKAGKYMFAIEAQAVAASAKAAPYGANYSIIIAEPKIWVGNDTITFTADTLSGYNWKKYYAIADITEEQLNNGTEVAAGFIFPWLSETYQGGRYSLRNPEFRLIGKTQDEVDHMYSYDQLQVQQNALKTRLDSAAVVNQLTHEAGYPWGHAVLKDSIDKFTTIYNELLTVVDANGNELQPDRVTLAYKDEILAAVRNMNSAISSFYSTNKHFQTLKDDIALCNTSLNAEANAAGDKATFQAVIAQAQAMVDATTVDADQVEAFDTMDDQMLTAKEVFEKGVASRANPASLYVKSKSLNFEPWTSKSTYSSDTQVNGWNVTIGTDGKQWDIAPNTMYALGGGAGIWRGTTVGPNGRMQMTQTITTPGVYEFRSRAFSSEYGDAARWAEYMAIATTCGSILDWDTFENTPVDTVYHPNVRLFFGPQGAVNDSITLTKCAPADYIQGSNGLLYTRGTPMEYSILYVKTSSDEETVEFGLEAFENGASAGANTFGFGDNRLYYLGSLDAYTTATEADYNAEVTKAKQLIAQYGVENEQVGWIVYKLMRLVGDANYPWAEGLAYTAPATLQDKQNVYLTLREYEAMIDVTVNPALGINDAPTAEAKAAAAAKSGVYSLSGVKVNGAADLNGLKPGLYIINGKKYLVK